MSWKDPVDILVIFMCTLIVVYGIACGFTGFSTGKKSGDWGDHKPASACDYKLAIIWRGQFRPGEEGEKDFFNSVTAQVEWFWKRNYTVFKVKYEYGFTVTHEEIVRCAVIFYRKNE